MGKHFTINELCRSPEAALRGIDNTPSSVASVRINELIDRVLDPIREEWRGPITVNGGFRCPALNKAVGGTLSSQHIVGEAADITAGSAERNQRLFGLIVQMERSKKICFDQLIDERNYSWIHISYRAGNNRGQILHL